MTSRSKPLKRFATIALTIASWSSLANDIASESNESAVTPVETGTVQVSHGQAVSSFGLSTEPQVVKYYQLDSRFNYRIALLNLVLEKTAAKYGTAKLEPIEQVVTQSRGLVMLQDNEIDVVFLATTKQREQAFLAVKIPIMRGILGLRVLLIHRDNIDRFASVAGSTADSFEQFKQLEAGFVFHWADLAILESNQIPVQKQPNYENLFAMLSAKRFDYFPRGVNEVWREIAEYSKAYPDLVVDKYIALQYEYPVYFFVNKNNTTLAKRIEEGLNRALADGSFKQLFLKHHKGLIKQAQLPQRKLFHLANPTLPASTPEIDKSWWLH
ncbi:transporter substrate-binding domain-containing protein [Shewanella schlegeliana]|uniref:Transporter substrate-binding domain-containing protein n=1 Tax=Shewanella schlegeliana TaxID=190308 RepID=A0ABS1SZX5_9GAMM|nr:transporter substrate-binding domain-containing protein [Shewanella schlegeliana]MBL4913565.1 transporter substrate-binding domain-containing protein [Shewanella schlegeliana]MCL1108456.1 transporter substrate-binding domain-containing protein [Shewanella schlegeliana]GIU28589.1 hypothetical protein TUM4433_16890 [Shewanella schlegeliana]